MAKQIHNDDFDPNSLVKTEDYQKEIDNINERLVKLEEIFVTLCSPEGLSNKLETTQIDSKKFDKVIGNSLIDLLNRDEKVKKKVTEFINSADRNYFHLTVKKFWFFIIGVVGYFTISLMHALIDAIVGWISSK